MLLSQITPRECAVDATVVGLEHPCREHVKIDFALDSFPESAPGMFLQLQCNQPYDGAARLLDWPEGQFPEVHDPSWTGREPYVRRPFSIADRGVDSAGRVRLSVISRAIGPGTRFLDEIQIGATLNITGPLGRGFAVPTDDRPLVLVGGGVGIPPLLYLARELAYRNLRRVVVVFGAMSADLLPVPQCDKPDSDGVPRRCLQLPGDARFDAIVTTDDGTLGLRGRVTDAIEKLAQAWLTHGEATPTVYACGPDGMLHAVARQTRRLGWDCQLCIEKNMGCGLGTCLSCVTRVVDAERPAGWRWALACTEGPVFERDRLVEFAEPKNAAQT